jgi:hypothetical protein
MRHIFAGSKWIASTLSKSYLRYSAKTRFTLCSRSFDRTQKGVGMRPFGLLVVAALVIVALLAGCAGGIGSEVKPSAPQGSTGKKAVQGSGGKTTSAKTSGAKTTSSAAPPIFPDPSLHPGATNPDVTQGNIDSTICKSGFTKTIRPPVSYTDKLEQQQISDEGLPGTPQDYEEDHLISLELGGAPKDEKNLWPEAYENRGAKFAATGTGSETKDKVENETKRLVCSGKITLSDAQTRIAADWRKLGTDEGIS